MRRSAAKGLKPRSYSTGRKAEGTAQEEKEGEIRHNSTCAQNFSLDILFHRMSMIGYFSTTDKRNCS